MTKKGELRAAGGVLLLLLLGKCLSLAANQAYLSFYGADNERLNIFSWAMQIPGYLFQSAGTALVSVVIPVYASLRATNRRAEAERFVSDLLGVCLLFSGLLCVLGLGLSFVLPRLTGFSDRAYAALCLRLVMPAALCYGLIYILQGVLQSEGHFGAAAAVNLPGGILILAYLALCGRHFGVTGLLVTVVAGLALQVVMLVAPARRAGFRWRPSGMLRDEHLRAALRRCLPVFLGALAYQLDLFGNHTLLTGIAPESVSLYQFVQSIVVGLVTVLTAAVNAVAYPELSALAARGERENYRTAFCEKLETVIFFLLPLTVGLAVLGRPALRLLAAHGRLTEENIAVEYGFLLASGACMVFLGIKEIADRALFALHTTKVSAFVNGLILLLNVPLAWLLRRVPALGAYAIPLSWSAVVAAGAVVLLLCLRRRLGGFAGLLSAAGKTLIASTVMGGTVWGCRRLLAGRLGSLMALGLSVLLGVLVFFLMAALLRIPVLPRLRRTEK